MPYAIRKNNNANSYSVKNKITGEIMSKATTKDKAEKQVRLLHMVDNKFKPRKA